MSDDLKERLRKDAALARSTFDFSPVHDMNSVLEKRLLRFEHSLNEAADRIEALEAERDEAIRQASESAREAGRYRGQLEASEWPGVVEGWKRRAEQAEAERDEAYQRGRREGLEEAARICDQFIAPVTDSDFVNGQSTAAQQIQAALMAAKDAE